MIRELRVEKAIALVVTLVLMLTTVAIPLSMFIPIAKSEDPFSFNERVNTDSGTATQYDPTIAVDVVGNVYVAWEDDRNGDDDIYFTNSSDGGSSWRHPNVRVSNDTKSQSQTNPSLAVDSSGNLYVAWQDGRNGDNDIYFANSTDGGLTWSDPNIRISTDTTNASQSLPSIAVDSSGTIYAVWGDRRNGDWDIYFANSTDGGMTWSDPNIKVSSGTLSRDQRNPTIAVNSSGTIYVAWQDERNGSGDQDIYFAKSTDGGTSWTNPNVRISTDTLNLSQRNPTIAVNSSNAIFIAWEDYREGNPDIYFANSTDGGVTWTSPNIRVNTDGGSDGQLSPSIACGNDTVHAVWHDYRFGESDPDIYWAESMDGGASWTHPNKRVSEESFDENQRDPSIAVSSLGGVYVVWEDNRNVATTFYDIYYADIEVEPTVDFIILTDSPGGTPLDVEDLRVGGDISIFASGYNKTGPIYVKLVEVKWTQLPSLGMFNNDTGRSTIFTAGLTPGSVDINGTNSTYPFLADNFTVNIIKPSVDYIEITDFPDGDQLADRLVVVNSREWGNCSAYNYTSHYIGTITVNWTAEGGLGTTPSIGPTPANFTYVDVGSNEGIVWFNASYFDGEYYYNDSVTFTVSLWSVDSINITYTPSGGDLMDIPVDVGFQEWGWCLLFNNTGGYMYAVTVDWTAEGGDSSLLNGTTTQHNGIDVGTIGATVWLNASYLDGVSWFYDSVEYSVNPPTVDNLNITETPGGIEISNKIVDVGHKEWGNASAYNISVDYIGTIVANWTAEGAGGATPSIGPTPGISTWIDVGLNGGTVWFNVSYFDGVSWHNDSVEFTVNPPTVDYIDITDVPNGTPLAGGSVLLGFMEWGNCSSYNYTADFIGTVASDWTAEGTGGATPSLLNGTTTVSNGINVGLSEGTVWLNASYFDGVTTHYDSVTYTVGFTPILDEIVIMDAPGNAGNPIWYDYPTYPSFTLYDVGEIDVFWAAGFNSSTGTYLGDIDVFWNTTDSIGIQPDTENGTVVYGPSNSTTFTANSDHGGALLVRAENTTLGILNWTNMIVIIPPTPDEIKIRNAPNGGGVEVTTGTYSVLETDKFYCAAYNDTVSFIGDVAANWSSNDTDVGLVTNTTVPGQWTNFTAQHVETDGTCMITAEYQGLSDSTGLLTVLEPTIDYINIRTSAGGQGNVMDTASFEVSGTDTYYCAGYNFTVDYIEDVSANWSVTEGIGEFDPETGNFTEFIVTMPGTGTITVTYGKLTNSSGTITILEVDIDGWPGKPTSKVKGKDKIEISWPEYPGTDLEIYIIQRAESEDGPWEDVGEVNKEITSYTDKGLKPDTTYYYRIVAVDDKGNPSPPSDWVEVKTEAEKEETPWIFLLLIIIIVIIVILLFLFLGRKKPKEEDIPKEETEPERVPQEEVPSEVSEEHEERPSEEIENNQVPPPPPS